MRPPTLSWRWGVIPAAGQAAHTRCKGFSIICPHAGSLTMARPPCCPPHVFPGACAPPCHQSAPGLCQRWCGSCRRGALMTQDASPACTLRQVGPRMSFQSAWSTNAVSICASCGLQPVQRLEQSRRFRLRSRRPLPPETRAAFAALVSVLGSFWSIVAVPWLVCAPSCMHCCEGVVMRRLPLPPEAHQCGATSCCPASQVHGRA